MHTARLALISCVFLPPILAQSGGARAKTLFELLPPSVIAASAVDRAGNAYVTGSGQIEADQLVGRYLLKTEFGASGARHPVVAENAEKRGDSQHR